MSMNAWHRIGAVSLLAAFWATGCIVTTDDDDDGSGGSGGSGGSAASGGSGGSTGGSGGSTGGTGGATGGSGGSGGAAGGTGGTGGGTGGTGTLSCEDPPVGATQWGCTDPQNACEECLAANCCDAFSQCYAYEPDDLCGWGGPETGGNRPGEYGCWVQCMLDSADSAMEFDTRVATCAGECVTPECGLPVVGEATDALIACTINNDDCVTACLIP